MSHFFFSYPTGFATVLGVVREKPCGGLGLLQGAKTDRSNVIKGSRWVGMGFERTDGKL